MKLRYPSALLMNSLNGWTPHHRDSFTLFEDPSFSLFFRDGITTILGPETSFLSKKSPLFLLESYLSEGYTAVGYIGYEFSRLTEVGFKPLRKKAGEVLPDVYFHFFKDEDIVSGDLGELKYKLRDNSKGFIGSPIRAAGSDAGARPYGNMTKAEYIKMVKAAKQYIAGGDIYQANLSQRFETALEMPPLSYFLNLYSIQPVPYGCYIDFGEFKLISGSMELFLRKNGRKVTTRPIKGTRKRGFTRQADAILQAELVSSEKERAENLMIVDLMRSDLGRICRYGSVKVNELFNVESYTTLHQMVSEIEGDLDDDVKIPDIIESTFPPGSVTGAPKKRALEIIDELEPHLRGPYCGAVGFFKPDGDFTLSVAIRILLAAGGKATFWAGGGIVWDSDPEQEYKETLIKARAIKRALGISE